MKATKAKAFPKLCPRRPKNMNNEEVEAWRNARALAALRREWDLSIQRRRKAIEEEIKRRKDAMTG